MWCDRTQLGPTERIFEVSASDGVGAVVKEYSELSDYEKGEDGRWDVVVTVWKPEADRVEDKVYRGY